MFQNGPIWEPVMIWPFQRERWKLCLENSGLKGFNEDRRRTKWKVISEGVPLYVLKVSRQNVSVVLNWMETWLWCPWTLSSQKSENTQSQNILIPYSNRCSEWVISGRKTSGLRPASWGWANSWRWPSPHSQDNNGVQVYGVQSSILSLQIVPSVWHCIP